MRLCNSVHEKNQDHEISRRDTSFCDAIANIYDDMVLNIFINTIAKPHVKRLRDIFHDEVVLIFFMDTIAKHHVKRLRVKCVSAK